MSKQLPAVIERFKTIAKENEAVLDYIKTVEISTVEMYEAGANQIVTLKTRINELTKEKEALLAPLKAEVKAAQELVDPAIKLLQEAEAVMKAALSTFDKERARKAQLALKEAAAAGFAGKAETSIALIDSVVATPSVSGVSFRNDTDFDVVDLAKVPTEYILINRAAVIKALKAGVTIPGITAKDKKTMVVRGNKQ